MISGQIIAFGHRILPFIRILMFVQPHITADPVRTIVLSSCLLRVKFLRRLVARGNKLMVWAVMVEVVLAGLLGFHLGGDYVVSVAGGLLFAIAGG